MLITLLISKQKCELYIYANNNPHLLTQLTGHHHHYYYLSLKEKK